MDEKQPPNNNLFMAFVPFFEKALDTIRPPYMKLLIVFVIPVLLAFFMDNNKCDNPSLGYILFIVMVLIFAFITALLLYAEMRFDHIIKTGEQFKSALRDTVTELQEERTGRSRFSPLKLVQILDERFNMDELQVLCLEMHNKFPKKTINPTLEFDNLSGQSKAAKVMALIEYCQRRELLGELITIVKHQRPDVRI